MFCWVRNLEADELGDWDSRCCLIMLVGVALSEGLIGPRWPSLKLIPGAVGWKLQLPLHEQKHKQRLSPDDAFYFLLLKSNIVLKSNVSRGFILFVRSKVSSHSNGGYFGEYEYPRICGHILQPPVLKPQAVACGDESVVKFLLVSRAEQAL